LPVVCPACDTVNQPSEDFCGGCGKTLAQVAAPPARRRQVAGPERRQLTVMFCDLVGSTALSHELDPEDLREVIRSYQEGTRHVIARYEGFVARYMGDGMLAYFGYPQAHEDDAARAIHAGLEIAQAPDLLDVLPTREGVWRPRVRIGIATGLVVVGDLIGEGASEEAAAVGETPNLAARLQTLAEPGSVVVAERTRELAGGRFEYTDRGTHELKGFDRPVRAWRVLRTSAAESRFAAARTRRMTPFIGRAEEIDLLLGRWRRASSAGSSPVVLHRRQPARARPASRAPADRVSRRAGRTPETTGRTTAIPSVTRPRSSGFPIWSARTVTSIRSSRAGACAGPRRRRPSGVWPPSRPTAISAKGRPSPSTTTMRGTRPPD
jgi:class 3 adenylate cyclase